LKKAIYLITAFTLIFVMNGCANVGPRMSPARNRVNNPAPIHSVAPAVPRTNNSGTYNNSTPYNSGTHNSGTYNSGTHNSTRNTLPNNNTVPNNTAPRSSANTTTTR